MKLLTAHRQHPTTKNFPAPNVSRAKLRNLGLEEGFSVVDWSFVNLRTIVSRP